VTLTPEAVVRKFFELAAEDDTVGILELVDPGVVWLGTHGGLDAHRVVRGSDGFLKYMQEIEQAWERFEVEVERVIESDDVVVAFLRETARGRGAIDVENETATVFKVRDGKIAEVKGYLDRDEALEAVGLRK
jgi:ketosteroid isomerase-like protein